MTMVGAAGVQLLLLSGVVLVAAALPGVAASQTKEAPADQGQSQEDGVAIRWWGHACFSITDREGTCVMTDPFPEGYGYPRPGAAPQVCLITHEHRDHNGIENVLGHPIALRGTGMHETAGLRFKGVATYHDSQQGAARGPNTVFVWKMGGLRIAHLGDLGHVLTEEQMEALGRVDVLMVPVGGFYTIDAPQAVQVIRRLEARIVLPMHYKTPAIPKSPVAPIDALLTAIPATWKVEKPAAAAFEVHPADLPGETVRVIVLKYE
jgi:L-ascorbate metabolism protein UlaG (beta-lactamase superfamily)